MSLRNAVRLLARGPRAAITSGSVAMVCLRSKAMIVSAENSVGLIMAPLRIQVSAIMP